jgi:transposase-like protein
MFEEREIRDKLGNLEIINAERKCPKCSEWSNTLEWFMRVYFVVSYTCPVCKHTFVETEENV